MSMGTSTYLKISSFSFLHSFLLIIIMGLGFRVLGILLCLDTL